jgi:TolA-binding protein
LNLKSAIKFAVLFAVATSLVGCGAGREQLQIQLKEVRNEMRDISESHKALVQRCENIQNRLELVEDRAAGQALRRTVRPTLPIVRIAPKRKVVERLPAATITQSDLDRMLPAQRVKAKTGRRAVPVPAIAARAGNVGVKRVPRRSVTRVAGLSRSGLPVGGPMNATDDPIAVFKKAQQLFKSGNLGTALRELKSFADRWPQHGFADNATLLMGKGRFQRAEYRAALVVFQGVLKTFPEGSEVPAALFMIGLTLDRLGQTHQAIETLDRLKTMFPATPSGRRAAQVLRTMSRR